MMRFTLKFEQETTPGYGIYLTTMYGHDFSVFGLIKEIYKIKTRGRPTKHFQISISRPVYACEGCEEMECQDCCEHDYDPDEGMMCLNCNAEYPY